ncbi:MAG: hypothetical protein ACO1TE_29465 [Prosthecobacter sp.]
MKLLFIILLMFLGGVLAYDRYLTPEGHRTFFANPSIDGGSTAAEAPRPVAKPAEPEQEVMLVSELEKMPFVPPQIEPLEKLTKNWTVFPPTAFPRHVKLSKPVTLKLESGTSVLPAGSHAVAVGAQANVLLISLTEESPPYGQTFVHDTDLPAQVRASYERWKKGRIENALVAWKRRLSAPVTMPQAVDPQGMPVRNRDGTYDLLLASMKSGQVTDIKLNKIQRWSTPQTRTIDGQPTWTVSVFYETMAFCGPMDAEAQAQIRNGQIVRWIYPGSGEPVP